MVMVVVLHDFDYPLHTRKTCIKRAFYLFLYALFGNSVRDKLPLGS